MRELAAIAAAAAAMLGGLATEGQDPRLSAALWAVGFLLAGVWVALMVLGWRANRHDTPPPPNDEGGL